MFESKNWLLDSASPMSSNSKAIVFKLIFKKQHHQFPISSRWQILEFYWTAPNENAWKTINVGNFYSLFFDEEHICQGFKPLIL